MAGGPGHRAEGHVKLPPLLSQDRRALAALALYDFSSRFVVECGPSSGLPTMQPPGVGFLNPTHYTQPAKKPLAKPNFIGLDGEVLSEPQLSRARDLGVLTPVKDCPPCPARTHNGFFPPVKLRSPVSDGSKSQRGLSKAVGHHSRTLSVSSVRSEIRSCTSEINVFKTMLLLSIYIRSNCSSYYDIHAYHNFDI